MDRATTNKQIWLELSRRYTGGGISREDAVRIMREDWCHRLTERTRVLGAATYDYKELTDAELNELLRCIRFDILPEYQFPLHDLASPAQVKKLRFLAVECALSSFTWHDVKIREDEKELTGDELRTLAIARWQSRGLKGAIFNALHTKWIHPVMHRWLAEGELRYKFRMPANPEYFHWADLKHNEADYLIKRFSSMHNANITRGNSTHEVAKHNVSLN